MMGSEEGRLVRDETGPSTHTSKVKWNVNIKEVLILYFPHPIYNAMDYLSLAAVLSCVYKSSIETPGCCIHSWK